MKIQDKIGPKLLDEFIKKLEGEKYHKMLVLLVAEWQKGELTDEEALEEVSRVLKALRRETNKVQRLLLMATHSVRPSA